jgi:hypothetical protein
MKDLDKDDIDMLQGKQAMAFLIYPNWTDFNF